MRHPRRPLALAGLLAIAFTVSLSRPAAAQRYYAQVNLVSDVPGLAAHTDPNLVNPWGISFSATSPFWISDNHTGVTTLYNGSGVPQSLVVTIPLPPGGTGAAAPTGQVSNSTSGFAVAPGRPAFFIFATEDGTISAWNFAVDATHAILKADRSATAVYKGLALAGDKLYAANFGEGRIDVFNSDFTFAGPLTDTSIPAGFAPFNVQNLHGTLVVTYAKQDAAKHDDERGPGNGFVDLLDPTSGTFTRLASGGTLNSPWGLALAPSNFGLFSNALLVGNFGDGRINAFNPSTGRLLGQMLSPDARFLEIDGLWALQFGNGGSGGAKNVLFFTAGFAGEQHGLFGAITPTDIRANRRPGLF